MSLGACLATDGKRYAGLPASGQGASCKSEQRRSQISTLAHEDDYGSLLPLAPPALSRR